MWGERGVVTLAPIQPAPLNEGFKHIVLHRRLVGPDSMSSASFREASHDCL